MLGVVVDTGDEISDTLCQILPRLRGAICAITNKSEGLTLGLMAGPCDLMLEEDDAVLGFYVVASLQWLSPEDVFDVV